MSEKLQSFASRVYATMAGALALTAVSAFSVAYFPALQWLASSPVATAIAVVDMVIALVLTWAWRRLSVPMATAGLAVYSILNGIVLSGVFAAYELGSAVGALVAATGLFVLLGVVGRATKIDLGKLSSVCLVGLIAIIITSLVNIFLGSSTLTLITSVGGVLVFLGLTIYDHQKVAALAASGSGDLDRYVVPAALQLYLDFINLFLYLLELFGTRRRDDQRT